MGHASRRGLVGALCFSWALSALAAGGDRAVNVMLFIGDGMGMEHVKAARYFKGEPLCFEAWPHFGLIDTESLNGITDSAAGATAIATGARVYNGVVGLANPGDSAELQTVLEYYQGKGKRTGLVTTDAMTGATPACFGAHAASRDDVDVIVSNYLYRTHPDILYGGGGAGLDPESAANAGYQVVADYAEMAAVDPAAATSVSGQFGAGQMPYEYDGVGELPHIWEMTSNALSVLGGGANGFFLMVEGGNIDHAAHNADTPRMIREVLAFDEAVQTALDWATNRTDTLIVVTADHETRGLLVTADNGAGNDPDTEWTADWHTTAPVGCWAWGPGSERVRESMANTNTFHVLQDASLLGSAGSIASATWTNMTMVWQSASGDVFRVEYTERIEAPDWKPLGVVTAAADSFAISDTNLRPTTNRFYRAVALP
jgi:alkaline phosphatase